MQLPLYSEVPDLEFQGVVPGCPSLLPRFVHDLEQEYDSIRHEEVRHSIKWLSLMFLAAVALFCAVSPWSSSGEIFIRLNGVFSAMSCVAYTLATAWKKDLWKFWDKSCLVWCFHYLAMAGLTFTRAEVLLGYKTRQDPANELEQPESHVILFQLAMVVVVLTFRLMPLHYSLLVVVLAPSIWFLECIALRTSAGLTVLLKLAFVNYLICCLGWLAARRFDLQFRHRFAELQRMQSESNRTRRLLSLLRAFADATVLLKGGPPVNVTMSCPEFDGIFGQTMKNTNLQSFVLSADLGRFNALMSEVSNAQIHMPYKRSIQFQDFQNMQFKAEVSAARIGQDEFAMAVKQISQKVAVSQGLDSPRGKATQPRLIGKPALPSTDGASALAPAPDLREVEPESNLHHVAHQAATLEEGCVSASKYFHRAVRRGEAYEKHLANKDSGPQHIPRSSIREVLTDSAHLAEDLDTLFAEMGRLTLSVRLNAPSSLKLRSGILRTVELKVPKPPQEDQEVGVQIMCRSEPTAADEGRKKAKDAGNFDIYVAETQRQIAMGAWKQTSADKAIHRFRCGTEYGSIFINLWAQKDCRVQLLCKLAQGEKAQIAQEHHASREEETGEDKAMSATTSLKKRLEAKLSVRRSDDDGRDLPSRDGDDKSVAPAPGRPKKRHKPFIFLRRQAGEPITMDDETVFNAQQRVCELLLGPCRPPNGFSAYPKPTHPAWQLLSAEAPKKLIRSLKKIAQDRYVFTVSAVVGGFAFFIKRQRELHLMRSQMAMRQLAWYKSLFVVSRLLFFMVFIAKGRRGIPQTTLRKSLRKVESDHSGEDESLAVEEVRRFVSLFSKRRAGQRSKSPPSPRKNEAAPTANKDTADERPQDKRNFEEVETIEGYLASLGFTLRPQHDEQDMFLPGCGGRRGRRLSGKTRKKAISKELADKLGRPVNLTVPSSLPDAKTLAPSSPSHAQAAEDGAESGGNNGTVTAEAADSASDEEIRFAEVHQEVVDRIVYCQASAEESRQLQTASAGRAQRMGANRFERFQKESMKRMTDRLWQQRQLQLEAERGDRPVVIVKRYNLQFFQEEIDLVWIALFRSMLLVITENAAFQTPHERHIFESKLRQFNQVRKVAQKKPGLFEPIEAALWSHPVVVQRAARISKVLNTGVGATAWKGTVFEGGCEFSSFRDPTGKCLLPPSAPDEFRVLRKVADIAGPFVTRTAVSHDAGNNDGCSVLGSLPAYAASATASGHTLKAFGDRDGAYSGPHLNNDLPAMLRTKDGVREVSGDVKPRELRIEDLRQKRLERQKKESPRKGNPLVEHADQWAQTRYDKCWLLRTDVPDKAHERKDKMRDFFEGLVVPVDTLAATSPKETQLGRSEDSPKPSTSASKRLQHRPAETKSSKQTPGTAVLPVTSSVKVSVAGPPQSLEEIEALIKKSDALQTILDLDADSHGFAARCPLGWKSGYRQQPMSSDEIRRARIVEKNRRQVDGLV